VNHPFFADQDMVVFQYCKTTTSVSLWLRMAERCSWITASILWRIMTSDFLQDLICSCKGKVMCGRSCVCNEQNMCCTELCPCQGSDFCMNPFSRSRENERFWRRRGKGCRLVGFSLSSCSWMK
jgi:hypothetical protein